MYLKTFFVSASLYEQLYEQVQTGGGHSTCTHFEFNSPLYNFKEVFSKMEISSCDMIKNKYNTKLECYAKQKNYENLKLAIKYILFYLMI